MVFIYVQSIAMRVSLQKIRHCFVAFFHYRQKKCVNGYVIATKLSFYKIFRLQPEFTLVYMLFFNGDKAIRYSFSSISKKGWAYFR